MHVVASGETLSDIAYAYYGQAKYWREVFEANRTVIGDDPAALEVGMQLTMPPITKDE
jgi:nucleoid-associated protein YgaU